MRIFILIFLTLAAQPVRAAEFTHYVLALTWNASWCTLEGDARAAKQCDTRHDIDFVLHGLWPQGDRGWPEFCRTSKRDPSRTVTAAMSDIMGSSGLAWYQWKKHGRCSGLSARDYFKLSRDAFAMIRRPKVLWKVEKNIKISPEVLEKAFLEANPKMRANQIAVTCKGGYAYEVRICLTKGLAPRACNARTERGCRADRVILPPIR